ncbi:MAG: glycoside hydrolase family 5 protein, partial [Treponema sp.]|nr:glycoside hydrolase family 5 protein [Treponema sp.]
MKKLFKLFGIIALAAIIGFLFTACGETNLEINEDPISPAFMEPQSFNDITAVDFVANIKVGWNLGNTFDAHQDDNPYGFPWLGGGNYSSTSVGDMEAAWVNHVTTKANINAIKNAGFNTIRIPVTWYKAVHPNFKIRDDWMKRVTEVVNYAVDNDMYVIINTHHDEGLFKFMNSNVEASLEVFEIIWGQIATQFRNYNEKLIFEGLNEPGTKGSFAEWSGGTTEERNNLNKYYQVFVDTVRKSGGNNDKRFLLLNTYAASANQNAMAGLVLPNDTADKKLIVSIHFYEPYNFALRRGTGAVSTWNKNNFADTDPITSRIDRAVTLFVSQGIPVIIGEFGAMNRNNEAVRAEWAEFYVSYARSKGIPCIWWDNASTTGDGE